MKYEYIKGIINNIEEKPLINKEGTYFLLTIFTKEGEIKASLFNTDLAKNMKNLKAYEFKIEKKGNFNNIIDYQDLDPEAEQELKNEKKIIPKQEFSKPKNYSINLQGKEYITHEGLLYTAHQKGLKSITTELVEFKDKELAVVKATTTMKDGSTFTGFGDANNENVNSMVAKHILRMAETRAINRSLRFATNIGLTSIEELD